METFTYWPLGTVLVVLAGAAMYDYRRNRQARKAFPAAMTKSDRRTAVGEDRLERAHRQDMAHRQIPPTGYGNSPDAGGIGGV